MTTVFGLHRCWKLHNRIYPIRSQSLLYNDQPGRQVDLTKVLPTTEVFWLNIEESYFACQVNASEKYLKIFKLSRLCDGNEDCYQGSDELSENHKCSSKCPSPCGSNGVCLKTRQVKFQNPYFLVLGFSIRLLYKMMDFRFNSKFADFEIIRNVGVLHQK